MLNKTKEMLHYLNKQLSKIIPEKDRYILIIIFWIMLWIEGYVTETRLMTFSEILLLISLYKISHKNVVKIYETINKYIEINQLTLLKIYKYKNPLIWLLIELELKLFYVMYKATKNNKNKNIMYNNRVQWNKNNII